MKKSLLALALFAAAGLAAAQTVHNVAIDGRITNNSKTYATVSGNGTSMSVANGNVSSAASGYSQANPIAGGMAVGFGGSTATSGMAMAYNVSTGNGTGSANSGGWSDAQVVGSASYIVPGTPGQAAQPGHPGFFTGPIWHLTWHPATPGTPAVAAVPGSSVQISGKIDDGMTNPVRNGVDFGVNAGRAQDGFAAATTEATLNMSGYTSKNPIAGGFAITGGVAENHTSETTAEAGAVTFTGGAPAGQSAAARWANGGTVITSDGNFNAASGN